MLDLAHMFVCQDCSGESIFHMFVMLKLDLEGWVPTLGQGPATWIRYTRCTPAKTKIDLHIIFLVCHRWVCDHCQSTKIPIWGVVADVSSFHML